MENKIGFMPVYI